MVYSFIDMRQTVVVLGIKIIIFCVSFIMKN